MSTIPSEKSWRTLQAIVRSELLSASAKLVGIELLATLPDDDESGTLTRVDIGALERRLHMSKGSFSRSFPFLEAHGFFTRSLKFYMNERKQTRTDVLIGHGHRILDRGKLGALYVKRAKRSAQVNEGCKTCPLMRLQRRRNVVT